MLMASSKLQNGVKEVMNETLEISPIFEEGNRRIQYQNLVLRRIQSFIDTSSCNVLPID